MSLKWRVSTPNNGSDRVHAPRRSAGRVIHWSNPGIPALTGCAVTVGGCSLIDPGSNSGQLSINDVVYIPKSTIKGKFNNTGNFKIGSALIAWSFDADINPNRPHNPPVIGEDDVRPNERRRRVHRERSAVRSGRAHKSSSPLARAM